MRICIRFRSKRWMEEPLQEKTSAVATDEVLLGCTLLVEHAIDTDDNFPIHQTLRPTVSRKRREEMEKVVTSGFIRPSDTP